MVDDLSSAFTVEGWRFELIPLPDGRVSEAIVFGESERALVHQAGTPSGAAPDKLISDVASTFGLSVVIPLRPGYGRSTPNPGRRVADVPADIDAVVAHLGVGEFVSAGYSGGGPHSLATSLLSPSCRAAAVVVSPAPRDAAGLDFYAGMAQSNVDEWLLADQGEAVVRPSIEKLAAILRDKPVEGFLELFDDALPAVDKAVYTPKSAPRIAAGLRKAFEVGIEGWLEDDMAMTTPWGFDISTVKRPVTFWAGRQDVLMSCNHSVWMAQQLPGADLHLLAEHGHMSLMRALLPAIVGDLVSKAGW